MLSIPFHGGNDDDPNNGDDDHGHDHDDKYDHDEESLNQPVPKIGGCNSYNYSVSGISMNFFLIRIF